MISKSVSRLDAVLYGLGDHRPSGYVAHYGECDGRHDGVVRGG